MMQLCLFQRTPDDERPRELTKALLKADDELVPKFLEALTDTNQQHVVRILDPEGSITGMSVMLHLGPFYIILNVIIKILSQET